MNRLKVPANEAEPEWIINAQNGNRSAFGKLVLLYRERVVNVIYRMCGDANLAEDIAQEAFIRSWKNLYRFKPGSSFRNWVYRIATNAALDILRRDKETVDISEIQLASSTDGPEAGLEKKERMEKVQESILSLSPASRAVLVLREYERLSYKEIADTLGIPIGTVMSRLNYARKRMLETLRPYLEE